MTKENKTENKTPENKTEAMIRVDHAGEYGAVRIYQGQSAIFRQRDQDAQRQVDEMAEHEKEHLAYFENKIKRDHVRPTVLLPLWHGAGFVLGAATALLGRPAAMACTQAVEEVIDEHYTRQLDDLGEEDAPLKEAIVQFRDDERAHHDIARAQGGDDFPLMRAGIGAMCRVAIALSSRF